MTDPQNQKMLTREQVEEIAAHGLAAGELSLLCQTALTAMRERDEETEHADHFQSVMCRENERRIAAETELCKVVAELDALREDLLKVSRTGIEWMERADALKKAVEEAPHEEFCSGEDWLGDNARPACDCWLSRIFSPSAPQKEAQG